MKPSYLGIDLGSISTKGVLIDENKNIVDSIYIRSRDTESSLREILNYLIKDGIEIKGAGVTGSGREFAKNLINADIVKTEIITHAIGNLYLQPDVRTIIDIGGEDSKLILLENGVMRDFNMNTICLTGDTNITTENFTNKSINKIRVGDKVLTHNGNFKEVKRTFKRKYEGCILEINCSKVKRLKITPEHPILGIKRHNLKYWTSHSGYVRIQKPDKTYIQKKFSYDPEFILAKDLKKGDFIAIPFPSEIKKVNYVKYTGEYLKHTRLKKIKDFHLTEDTLRLLGYYLAEGNLDYNRKRSDRKIKYVAGVGFTFNINEKGYINDVINICKDNFDVSIRIDNRVKRNTTHIDIYNKSLGEMISYLCGSKGDKKIMSPELLFLEPKLQLEIIKGFFRGDAHFKNKYGNSKEGSSLVVTTISEDLAYQIYWILLRNKIKCEIYKPLKKTKGNKWIYHVAIYGGEINKLNDNNFIIKENTKKGEQFFKYKNWLFIPIKEIERREFKDSVYNLEVDEDNSYIANLLPVHNCSAGMGACMENIAIRLGIKIEEFGDLALKVNKTINLPMKCGVLMSSAVVSAKNKGERVEDILMGVTKAVARNFLSLCARGKDLEEPIIFCGMTAHNKALHNALEEEIGKKIFVPQNPELIGAFGIALLTAEEMNGKQTSFSSQLLLSHSYKIIHNREDCIVCGNCFTNAPKYFIKDEDGKSRFIKEKVEKEDLENLKEVCKNCPMQLINLKAI